MAVYCVAVGDEGERVSLQYEDHRGRQDCGVTDLDLLVDTIAFACDDADGWDQVITPWGAYVRQVEPGGGARA
ncbi:MAG TPA: hypothetical protein VD838_22770 [Anaeromyxobacteraceae bacterium]|nr:hypothetical protein [Anaeromyxobacteraceae bacterium]